MALQKSKKKSKIPYKENLNLVKGQKYLWKLQQIDSDVASTISYDHNLSLSVARVLCARGFTNKSDINAYLFSTFEKDVFDPNLFKDSQKAVDRLQKAIENKERILVFGDYDVDGITSTALLLVSLLPLDANINFYLPNRIKDGYGLSKKIVKKALDNKYDLLITVDNGICAFDAANLAFENRLDLIITDHHRPHETLPKATAIIDSNQPGCQYPYKELAGVGTIFKIVSMLYDRIGKTLPDKVYELLMLGTIADVAPLTEENRFWVQFGLAKANKQRSVAIDCLVQNGGREKSRLDSLDIAFTVAPQLNALGRLDDPRQAVEFLISSDANHVARIARTLKIINEERKKVDRRIYMDIENAILEKRINLDCENVIMAASSDWPAGVIGLVAGRLAQNYARPTFLFHLDKKGVLKGSCRSIPEFNVFDALNECKDLLIQFGGHSFAAGLKLNQSNLPALKKRLEEKISKELDPQDLVPKIKVDSLLDLPELKSNFISDLQKLEPFGNSNEQPVFLIKDVTLLSPPMLLKEQHVKCKIFAHGVIKPVIFFNRPELYTFLSNIGDASFDIAAYVVKNEWDGRVMIELQGLDVAIK